MLCEAEEGAFASQGTARACYRHRAKMASGLASKAYKFLFRRTSTFTLTVIVTALFFERGFNQVTDAFFERHNQGKLWKHIKHKYEKPEEEST